MKKALYIGGFCMPDGNAAAQRVLSVGKLLQECGFKVRFSGLKRNITEPEEGGIENFEYKNYPYPTTAANWIKYLTGRDYAISEIRKYKPDIVILYNHPAHAIEHITKYCHKNGIKVIADITEWYEPSGSPIFKFIKAADTSRRMKFSHKKVDGLICISNYLENYYADTDLPILNLPPLVDVSQSKWHQSCEKDDSEIKIIYAGSPGANKDRLDLIIKSMATVLVNHNCKVRFDVIGITKDQYVKAWADETDYPFVSFQGRIPHEEVVRQLLSADFQIFLRSDTLQNRAGFPTKFVETITSRTIPITNLNSNLSDYLDNNVTGLVIKSLKYDDIKETIVQALSLTPEEIVAMKQSWNTDIFDYRNYIHKIRGFITTLNEDF